MKTITKIFVDMDGVLADFVRGVQGPKYLNGPLVSENTYDDRKVELSNKGLFADLPPMADMYSLIEYIKTFGVDWEILTASGVLNRAKVVQDKIYWIRKYVDKDVLITATLKGKHKAVYARPDYVLIDDRKDNIEAWTNAGGIGILHTSAADTIKQLRNYQDTLVAQNTA